MNKGETMLNALAALYIQCPESIAQDVAEKVGAYVEEQDKQLQALTKERDALRDALIDKSEKGSIWISGHLIEEVMNLAEAMGSESHEAKIDEFKEIFEKYNVRLWY